MATTSSPAEHRRWPAGLAPLPTKCEDHWEKMTILSQIWTRVVGPRSSLVDGSDPVVIASHPPHAIGSAASGPVVDLRLIAPPVAPRARRDGGLQMPQGYKVILLRAQGPCVWRMHMLYGAPYMRGSYLL
ncbi:hypothetical protein NL676_015795 [Syzygium grande]|nr:hypothetical protein NL676_015795 [Syzygium grande]